MSNSQNPEPNASQRRLNQLQDAVQISAGAANVVLAQAYLAAARRLAALAPDTDRTILTALTWAEALSQPGVFSLVEAHFNNAYDLEQARLGLDTGRQLH